MVKWLTPWRTSTYERLFTQEGNYLVNSIDLIDHLIMYCSIYIYILYTFKLLQTYYCCNPFSFNEKLPHAFYVLLLVNVWILYLCLLESHFNTWWHIENSYNYSAYKWWSYKLLAHGCNMVSGFGTELFLSSWLFVVQCWICATFLFPDTVTKTGPHVHHYVKFLLQG